MTAFSVISMRLIARRRQPGFIAANTLKSSQFMAHHQQRAMKINTGANPNARI
jgi:hypothetical protein